MIRSVQVSFSLFDINAYYGLMDMGHDEYETYTDNLDYKEVIETLDVEGANWEFDNGRHKRFEAKYLSKVSHIWKYFICFRLMPTTHCSTMDRE